MPDPSEVSLCVLSYVKLTIFVKAEKVAAFGLRGAYFGCFCFYPQ